MPKMTVLDALEYITEVIGADIAYRSSCGTGRCGTCGVLVNGKPVLACMHPIKEEEITIEPLPNFPVLRDLVVDRSNQHEIVKKVKPFLVRKRPYNFTLGFSPDNVKNEELRLAERFTCVHCMVCVATCPIIPGFKDWLGPRSFALTCRFTYDPRDDEDRIKDVHDQLWYCASCNACNNLCPYELDIRGGINDLRSKVVEVGLVPRTLQDALSNIYKYGNPWGGLRDKRTQWSEGLNIKKIPEEKADYLYFVGCTPSYDIRAQEIARSTVAIFQKAKIDFGILGKGEICCGEPALRIGEKGLFEMTAKENINTLNRCGVKKIVTTCPHGYNTFKKEYLKYGGDFEVTHHTQLILELIEKNKLVIDKKVNKVVTYHDPCFLSKHNNIYEAPRKILESIPGLTIVEMPRNRENSFCCGGGGGRMWFEEKVEIRPSTIRAQEAAEVKPDIVATSCPFCIINLEDGIKTIGKEEIKVKEITEILLEAIR